LTDLDGCITAAEATLMQFPGARGKISAAVFGAGQVGVVVSNTIVGTGLRADLGAPLEVWATGDGIVEGGRRDGNERNPAGAGRCVAERRLAADDSAVTPDRPTRRTSKACPAQRQRPFSWLVGRRPGRLPPSSGSGRRSDLRRSGRAG
jgi:hypothetical protein